LSLAELGDLQNLLEIFKKERPQWVTDKTTIEEILKYIEFAFDAYADQ